VADMGSPRIKRTDVDHFSHGLLGLANRHGHALCEQARRHFEAGYARCS
jgi:hypothetical protein